MLSYIFVIGSLTTNIVANFYTFKSSTEMNELKVIITIITFIAVTPLCLIRNFGHLAGISHLSMAAVGGIILLVLYSGLNSLLHSSSSDILLSVNYFSLFGMLRTLGSVVFAFSFSPALFPALLSAEEELLSTAPTTAQSALFTTVAAGCGGCFLIGLFGYLSFGPNTLSDILLNYSSSPMGLAMQAIFVLHLSLVLPADLVVLRPCLYNLMNKDARSVSGSEHVLVTVGLLGALGLVSGGLLGLGGSLSSVLQVT